VGGPLKRSRLALPALLVVTILWGCTFIWMKQSLDAAGRALGRPGGAAVVSMYIAVRFVAAAALLALWPRARAGLDRAAWRGGALLGALLFAGFLVQMLGLQGVTPPVSAFLTSLYVVFAAILTAWTRRTRPSTPLLAGVALATFGAGFIEGPPHLTFGTAEWLTVVSAAIFAVHILATDTITKASAPLGVTVAMFACTAALALIALPVAMRASGVSGSALAPLLSDPAFVRPLILATIFATVLALTLMNQFQRELDPVRAAILFSLEPVWTTLIAAATGLGRPGAWLWLGGGALLAGNLIAEWGALRPATAAGSQ